jgi:hypothetical protein
MSETAEGAYGPYWHQQIEIAVNDHREAIHGNGDLGLKSRMSTVENYIVESREERKAMRRWMLGIVAGILILLGDRAVTRITTALQTPQVTQLQTSTSTTTNSSSTTTHKH